MDFLQAIEDTAFSTFVRTSPTYFGFSGILLVHTIGMGVIVGVAAGIDLRILGFAPAIRLAPLEKYLPVLWFGFWMNAITGVILMMGYATTILVNPDFYVKMAFVALSLINLRMLKTHVFRDPLIESEKLSSKAKFFAWMSMFLWLGVITTGRLLAYVGQSNSYK